jgi:hypothetical protein
VSAAEQAPAPETEPARVRSEPAAPDEPAREERAPDVVAQAALVPMVTGIRPGRPFFVALSFAIAAGYRLSWKYAADVGGELRAEFSAPPGFDVGPVLYPVPERFVLDHGLETFGYRDRAAVFVRIQPPAHLSKSEPQRIDVRAAWMACKRQCIAEKTQAFVELMADWSAKSAGVESELAPLLETVPTDFATAAGAETAWLPDTRDPTLRFTAPGVRFIDFFPVADATRKVVDIRFADDRAVVDLAFEQAPGKPPHTVYGTLIANRAGKRIGYDVEVPWKGFEGTSE